MRYRNIPKTKKVEIQLIEQWRAIAWAVVAFWIGVIVMAVVASIQCHITCP
jgi:hypothetical protein